MPSVIQLLKNTLPEGSEVVCGDVGLYNEVSWVISLRPTPPGFDVLKGGEFALIGADIADGLNISLSHLVSTLSDRGISGIAILGEISKEAQQEAITHKVPLIQLPQQTNIAALEKNLTQLINEERQLLYQREREFNQSMMELAVAGSGIQSIVQKLRELTGRNLGFIDLNYNPHFALDPEISEAFRKQVHQALSRLRSASITISTPVIGLNLTEQLACFLGMIRIGKDIKGYLMLLAPHKDISEIDRLAVRVGTLAMAVEMSRRQAVEETEARFESDMVEDLVSGDLSTINIEELSRRLNINLSKPFVCLIAHIEKQQSDQAEIIRYLAGKFPKAHSYFRNDELVILSPLDAMKNVTELRKLGKEFFDSLKNGLNEKITLGIGRSYQGAEQVRVSYREAEQSLSMGLQLFGSASLTCFADLGVYRLLFALKDSGELSAFHQEYLGALVEYDRKHDGEMISTLKSFLNNNAIAEAAREIHVHRNTLLYRLERIQEITGANLEDGETRLALHIAILADEVLKAT